MLVFAGTEAIIVQAETGAISHVEIALTFGLVVLALIYAFGEISGAHFNPAVTLGFCLSGRFPLGEAIPYGMVQILGAFAAIGMLRGLFTESTTLGETVPRGAILQILAEM